MALLDTDGTLDADFDAGANYGASFQALALQADGRIIVGGDFNRTGGAVLNYVGRLTAAGLVDTSFVPGTGPTELLAAVLQPDGKVIVGGGIPGGLSRLNTDGGTDTSFHIGTGTDGTVYTLALQSDGSVLAGGTFTSFNGSAAPYLVRLLPNGSRDASFAPVINALVAAVVVQTDGKIVVGGDFTMVDGQARSGLARLNPGGTLDPGFVVDVDAVDTAASRTAVALVRRAAGIQARAIIRRTATSHGAQKVRSLVYVAGSGGQADKLVVGGLLHTVGNVARSGLARVLLANGTAAVDNGFDPGTGPDAAVNAVAVQSDGSVLVGGDFASFNGVARAGLARLMSTGSVDTGFDAGLQGTATSVVSVRSLSVLGGAAGGDKVLVGGSFAKVGALPHNALARLLVTKGTADTSFQPGTGADGAVNALVPQPDGRTIIAGQFDSVNGQQRRAVARLLGDKDAAVTPIAPPAITSTAVANGQIGEPFTYQIQGTNMPVSYGASGLPPGLAVNADSGLIAGTPAATGIFQVTLSATNGSGRGTAPLNLVINEPVPVATLVATIPSVNAGSGEIGEFTLILSPAPAHNVVANLVIRACYELT